MSAGPIDGDAHFDNLVKRVASRLVHNKVSIFPFEINKWLSLKNTGHISVTNSNKKTKSPTPILCLKGNSYQFG